MSGHELALSFQTKMKEIEHLSQELAAAADDPETAKALGVDADGPAMVEARRCLRKLVKWGKKSHASCSALAETSSDIDVQAFGPGDKNDD